MSVCLSRFAMHIVTILIMGDAPNFGVIFVLLIAHSITFWAGRYRNCCSTNFCSLPGNNDFNFKKVNTMAINNVFAYFQFQQ